MFYPICFPVSLCIVAHLTLRLWFKDCTSCRHFTFVTLFIEETHCESSQLTNRLGARMDIKPFHLLSAEFFKRSWASKVAEGLQLWITREAIKLQRPLRRGGRAAKRQRSACLDRRIDGLSSRRSPFLLSQRSKQKLGQVQTDELCSSSSFLFLQPSVFSSSHHQSFICSNADFYLSPRCHADPAPLPPPPPPPPPPHCRVLCVFGCVLSAVEAVSREVYRCRDGLGSSAVP